MARSVVNPRSSEYERTSISRGANAVTLCWDGCDSKASGGGGTIAAASRERDEGCDSAH
jgi:hypothetical protein